MSYLFRSFIDIIFPHRCLLCHSLLPDEVSFCAVCWDHIEFSPTYQCITCGVPLEYDFEEYSYCDRCVEIRPFYDKILYLYIFNQKIGELIHNFKYYDQTSLARQFSLSLSRRFSQEISNHDLIIPVPLHYRKLWQRKYNQAALLAKFIQKKHHGLLYNPFLIVRAINTPQLAHSSARQREEIIKNAFTYKSRKAMKELYGKRILLIDDVITTGATANECAKTLKEAGAKEVTVMAIARTKKFYRTEF